MGHSHLSNQAKPTPIQPRHKKPLLDRKAESRHQLHQREGTKGIEQKIVGQLKQNRGFKGLVEECLSAH